jgi:hypothetical protein
LRDQKLLMVAFGNFPPHGFRASVVAASFKPLDCFPPACNIVKRLDRFLPAIFSQQPFGFDAFDVVNDLLRSTCGQDAGTFATWGFRVSRTGSSGFSE